MVDFRQIMRDHMELKSNFDALDAEINPLLIKGKTTAELVKIDESIKIINKQVKRLAEYVQSKSVLNMDGSSNSSSNNNNYPSYPFY